jgi:hypothetical protein
MLQACKRLQTGLQYIHTGWKCALSAGIEPRYWVHEGWYQYLRAHRLREKRMWLNIFGVDLKPEGSSPIASARQTVISNLQYSIVYRAWRQRFCPGCKLSRPSYAAIRDMPVHRTRDARHQNAHIDSRTLVLFFKCYEQLCLHEVILTYLYYIGTSAIWSSGQAVPQKAGPRCGPGCSKAATKSDHPVVVCAPLSVFVHFGTLLIGRHGIDKAMQVEAARVQCDW